MTESHDPASAALVRRLAARVAAQHGADLAKMRRALGSSNATWVGDGIAVRITHVPADASAEIALVHALPHAVGHPRIVGAGSIQGHGWIVTDEVQGENLHEAWPTMTPTERQ